MRYHQDDDFTDRNLMRATRRPTSEWELSRRDEAGALHRLLSSGNAACANDPVCDRWVEAEKPSALVRLCHTCPLQQPCLDYALAYDVQGVWGGTTASQRRRLRRGATPEPVRFQPYLASRSER